jgi:hypothetical protein
MEIWRLGKNVLHSPVDLMLYIDSWIRSGRRDPDSDVLRYFGILLIVAAVIIAAF